MSRGGTTKFEIPKFNGKNFAMWKVRMYAILVKDGCAMTLKGKGLKPIGMTDIQFEEKDEIAKADILLALDDKVLFNVQVTNTTAKALWESLIKVYEDKSLVNKIYLRRQLYNLKMKDGASIHEHLNEFNTLLNDLLGIDVKIDEEEQATLLLCSMPDSWDNLIMGLSHVSKLDMDSVVASLLSEELRRKSLETTTSSSGLQGLQVMGSDESNDKVKGGSNNWKGKGKFKPKGEVKCYYCDKVGHIIKHCKKLAEDKQNGKDQEKKDANVINFDELIVISDCSHEHGADYSSNWVVDSGATFHSTPNRRLFTTYKGGNFGVVKMGNEGKSKVIGVGDVQVVTNLGHNLILKNVRHVPDLRMNLMSVADLDDRGYASKFAKGAWELSKGNLVVARGERCYNLYRTTLRSSKSSVTSTLNDSTMGVWRRRHGHTKVNNKGKGTLHGGFSEGRTHDVKEKVMQEGENSLHKSKVHGLVKLFEDKFALKEEAKLKIWRKRMVQGSLPNGVGDMC